MTSITLRSPAKLNLFLKVLRKREDGYHDLKTLFERINLYDDIKLTPNKSGAIRIFCNHPHVPKGPKNLVYQAAAILQKKFCISQGVDIQINKRIPVAAGLGGGSSNAATVLLGLNKIWKLSLPKKELVLIGQTVGSDVPFFLYNCSWALGLKRGDAIKPILIPVKLWHVLVVPCLKIYSREVFTRLNLRLTKTIDNVNILIHYLKINNINRVDQIISNDLERSILSIRPSLVNVTERLRAYDLQGVSFSGSGPAVFGLVKSQQHAEKLKKLISRFYKQVYCVRTL